LAFGRLANRILLQSTMAHGCILTARSRQQCFNGTFHSRITLLVTVFKTNNHDWSCLNETYVAILNLSSEIITPYNMEYNNGRYELGSSNNDEKRQFSFGVFVLEVAFLI
jgi:hypothetical protein